jgi:hypothetical protein
MIVVANFVIATPMLTAQKIRNGLVNMNRERTQKKPEIINLKDLRVVQENGN